MAAFINVFCVVGPSDKTELKILAQSTQEAFRLKEYVPTQVIKYIVHKN